MIQKEVSFKKRDISPCSMFAIRLVLLKPIKQNEMKPTQLIPFEKAQKLSALYNEKRAGLHLKDIGKEDANAVWYSLTELESYIAYIKEEGQAQGYHVDGIRFYMGVYPDAEDKAVAGFSTIFLSPTGTVSDGALKAAASKDGSKDILTINAMNFGSMGNPPKLQYGE